MTFVKYFFCVVFLNEILRIQNFSAKIKKELLELRNSLMNFYGHLFRVDPLGLAQKLSQTDFNIGKFLKIAL